MRTPNFFFPGRVNQLLTRLRSIDVHETEKQIVNILVRNLSDHYEIEKRYRLDSPFIWRRDVEHIVRAFLGHPQNASARIAVGIGGDAQPTRACCWWRVPDHTWRVWRTEERRCKIKWRWTWNTAVLVWRWRQPLRQPPTATAVAPSAVKTADGEFWSRGTIRRRYQKRRVASRGIAALAQRLGAPL